MSYDFELIKKHLLEKYPKEGCGLILKDDSIVFCENVSENPTKSFRIDSSEILEHAGNIEYIFHSHCVTGLRPSVLDPRTPSKEDLEGQIVSGVKWLIFSCDGIFVGTPLPLPRTPNSNYIGRPFIWYFNDCYTLVQDYYLFEKGIQLPEGKIFAVNEVRKQPAVFSNYIEEYGFAEVSIGEPFQNGDLFIVDNSGYSENHLLIYHNGKVLHQDLLSKEEPIERYMDRIRKRLRYVG